MKANKDVNPVIRSKFLLCFKYIFLFFLGGSIYYNIECLYRGYSHISMFIVGGMALILIGLVNEIMGWNWYFEFQVLVGLVDVLFMEFVSGCIVNLWLGLNVWDYSDQFGNILGQICPLFALIWIPLIAIAILLDDFIRWFMFGEEKPRYRFVTVKLVKKLIKKIKKEK